MALTNFSPTISSVSEGIEQQELSHPADRSVCKFIRPGSHLSTHSLRKRISSVCRTLGSCLHIFTKARSSLTLRGSIVKQWREAAGAARAAARFQARALLQRDLVKGAAAARQNRLEPPRPLAPPTQRSPHVQIFL